MGIQSNHLHLLWTSNKAREEKGLTATLIIHTLNKDQEKVNKDVNTIVETNYLVQPQKFWMKQNSQKNAVQF